MKDRPDYMMVDLTILAQRDIGTGIQRMVRSVWKELRAMSFRDLHVVPIASFPGVGYCYLEERPDHSFVRSGGHENPCDPSIGDVFLGLDLNVDGLPAARAQVAKWRAAGVPIWVAVYDLIPIVHPRWFTWRYARRFKKWFKIVEALADGILCISAHTAQQVEHRERTRWNKRSIPPTVSTVAPGADLGERKAPQYHTLPPTVPKPFVLMVGTVEPRKGYQFALKIFEGLWHGGTTKPALVIVGKAGWKTPSIQRQLQSHRLAGESLFWLRSVDDNQLEWLYDNASLLLAASKDEGFGLPIAEALSRSLPVLANDIPPFREFEGFGVAFMTYGDVKGAATNILNMINFPRRERDSASQWPAWKHTAIEILDHMGLAGRING